MESKDLRIGNIILQVIDGFGCYYRINQITEHSLVAEPISQKQFDIDFANESEGFHPIPLTPEILEKCGFVKEVFDNSHEEDGHFYSLRLSEDRYVDLSLLSGDKNGICEVFLFPYEQLRYQYLHQVQNIVHSLTGKELEITI